MSVCEETLGVHWHARYCSPTIRLYAPEARHGVKLPSYQAQGSDLIGFNNRTKYENLKFLSTHFKTNKIICGVGGSYKSRKKNSKNIDLKFSKVEELVKSYENWAWNNQLSEVTK